MPGYTIAELTALSELATDDKFPVFDTSAAGLATQTKYVAVSILDARFLRVAQNLADVGSVATARVNLGLGTAAVEAATAFATAAQGALAATALQSVAIGVSVQAYDAELAALAALAVVDGNFIVGNGSTWVAENGATVRTSLELGTADSPQFAGLGLGVAKSANEVVTLDVTWTSVAATKAGVNIANKIGDTGGNISNNVFGLFFEARAAAEFVNNSTGILAGVAGVTNHYGGGTLASAYGATLRASNRAAGTITTAYGLHIDDPLNDGGGTITNLIGLRIDNQILGSTAAKSYAMQVAGGNCLFNVDGIAGYYFQVKSDNIANMFYIDYTTDMIGISSWGTLARLDVQQVSTTGAKPPLALTQKDVSEEFTRYVGTSANGVLTQSIVDDADVSTRTLVGWTKDYIQDDAAVGPIPDGYYFRPFYSIS